MKKPTRIFGIGQVWTVGPKGLELNPGMTSPVEIVSHHNPSGKKDDKGRQRFKVKNVSDGKEFDLENGGIYLGKEVISAASATTVNVTDALEAPATTEEPVIVEEAPTAEAVVEAPTTGKKNRKKK